MNYVVERRGAALALSEAAYQLRMAVTHPDLGEALDLTTIEANPQSTLDLLDKVEFQVAKIQAAKSYYRQALEHYNSVKVDAETQ